MTTLLQALRMHQDTQKVTLYVLFVMLLLYSYSYHNDYDTLLQTNIGRRNGMPCLIQKRKNITEPLKTKEMIALISALESNYFSSIEYLPLYTYLYPFIFLYNFPISYSLPLYLIFFSPLHA